MSSGWAFKDLTGQRFGRLIVYHLTRAYANGGIDPEEGLAIYQLSLALKGAQTVDEKQVAKIVTGEVADTPVAAVSVEKES